jgi:hypothetical protein
MVFWTYVNKFRDRNLKYAAAAACHILSYLQLLAIT